MPVPVTENIYHSLVWTRFLKQPRLVWVDALCIRQNNNTEKSTQVARMGSIYRNAHVVSWLGATSDVPYIEPALEHMDTLVRLTDFWLRELMERLDKDRKPEDGPRYPPGARPSWIHSGGMLTVNGQTICTLSDLDDPIWDGLYYLNSCPFFDRLWVVQEYALSSSNVFQVGSHCFALETLGNVSAYICRNVPHRRV